jgi:hypothetical protein
MQSGFAMVNNGGYIRWYMEAKQLHPYIQREGEVLLYGGFGPKLTYYDAHRCLTCGAFTIIKSSTRDHEDQDNPEAQV